MVEGKAPWIFGNLTFQAKVLEEVRRQAVEAYGRDEESCGLLYGPAGDPLFVDGVFPMENRANKLHKLDPETYPRTGRMYFDIDPMKFAKFMREKDEAGAPVKVLYHSHLDAGAYFSETDATTATMGGDSPAHALAYLVTSVLKGKVDEMNLFIWDTASRSFVVTPFSVRE
jgi:proteasome lid subunit RPN8/RPN11